MNGAEATSMVNSDVIVAVIGTLGVIATGWFGVLIVKIQVNKKKTKTVNGLDADGEEEDAALIKYENNPAQFVKDVLADNVKQREYAGEWEARYMDSQRDRQREYTEMMDRYRQLEGKFDDRERHNVRFMDAMGRYIIDIFASWNKTPEPPQPRASDAEILRPIIPGGQW